MNNIQVYCDVDENGNFTDVVIGQKIIPNRQYQFFFLTNDTGILTNPNNYKVDIYKRELIVKEN